MLTALLHLAPALENHLWQSTAFAAVAWLIAIALRKNQARTRYWIWFAASMKFLLPFSLLFAIGSYPRPTHVVIIAPAPVSVAVRQMAQPFSNYAPVSVFAAPIDAHDSNIPLALTLIWALGFLIACASWWRRWRRVQKACDAAAPARAAAFGYGHLNVPVKFSASLVEPGVFGILRPVLMLPAGIADRLTPAQMNAILAHEMSHIRRRDNLTAALHMFVAAVFWFHPLVWWIGARLVEERENACDEEVMRLGGEPETYAEGILEVCKFYTESPVVCVSGVSGAELKKRIVRIMTRHLGENLSRGRKTLLLAIATAAVAAPLVFGVVLNPPRLRAQSLPYKEMSSGPLPSFEVASIKLDNSGTRGRYFQFPDPGRFRTTNVTAHMMIQYAYNVKPFQVIGGPSWSDAKGYDIEAKIPDSLVAEMKEFSPNERSDEVRLMFRSLLAQRFKLQLTHDTKIEPEYALVVAKGGPKLTPTAWVESDPKASKPEKLDGNGPHLMLGPGKISAVNQPVSGLCDLLAFMPEMEGRLVLDQTGIKGKYDYTVLFSSEALDKKFVDEAGARPPANADDSAPSIFTALEEQLGLKLQMTKGPVDIYTIEHIEEPSEN